MPTPSSHKETIDNPPVKDNLTEQIFDTASKETVSIFYTSLVFYFYCLVVWLGLSHSDFYSPGKTFAVPIFQVTVPAKLALVAFPLLLSLIHISLAMSSKRLLHFMSSYSSFDNSTFYHHFLRLPIFLRFFFPSTLNYPNSKNRGSYFFHVMIGFGVILSPPILISLYWWSSLFLHELMATILIISALLVSIWASVDLIFFGNPITLSAQSKWPTVFYRFILFSIAVTVLIISLIRTGTVPLSKITLSKPFLNLSVFNLASADLENARISQIPADYVHRFTSARNYTLERLNSYGPISIDGNTGLRDSPLLNQIQNEWHEQRHVFINNLIKAKLNDVDLRGANLVDAKLVGVHAHRAKFRDADMERAELEGVQATGADFSGANLMGAHLEGARLFGADFSNAKLDRAHLQETFLRCARFEGTTILFQAQLDGAYLDETSFGEADLRFSSLRGIYAKRANFGSSDMQGADLTGAILWHSDLSGVKNLTREQLESVIIDEQTKLPKYLETAFFPKFCVDEMPRIPFPYIKQWWITVDVVVTRAICPRKVIELPDHANCDRFLGGNN